MDHLINDGTIRRALYYRRERRLVLHLRVGYNGPGYSNLHLVYHDCQLPPASLRTLRFVTRGGRDGEISYLEIERDVVNGAPLYTQSLLFYRRRDRTRWLRTCKRTPFSKRNMIYHNGQWQMEVTFRSMEMEMTPVKAGRPSWHPPILRTSILIRR